MKFRLQQNKAIFYTDKKHANQLVVSFWDNWIDSFSAQENLDTILGKEGCDLVISYKPLDKGIVKWDNLIAGMNTIKFNPSHNQNEYFEAYKFIAGPFPKNFITGM